MVEESHRVNIRALSDLIGSAWLSFTQPDRVRSELGVETGVVAPFAVINDTDGNISVVLDAEVMAADTTYFYLLVNDQTTAIAPADPRPNLEAGAQHPRTLDLSCATAKPD